MSFMKKVAKVAAPFASLIPGVGPLVGAGLGMLGGLGGGGGKMDKQTAALMQQQLAQQGQYNQQLFNTIGTQQKMSQSLIDKGMPLIDQGVGSMNPSLDFFKKLLSGKADEALAGPIADLRAGSNNALQNVNKFAHRGASAGAFADRTNRLGQDIARLRTDSMFQASQGLMQGGSTLLGAGSNLATGGLHEFGNTMNTLLGARGQDINKDLVTKQLDQSKWGGLGEGIGNLLGILLQPGGILNKNKTTSGRTSGGWGVFNPGWPKI